MPQDVAAPDTRHAYHYPLDLIRFAAASSVVAFHLAFYSWASNPVSTTAHAMQNAASFQAATPFAWYGWVGVEVFFVISGFVIANSAVGVSSAGFLKSRALRLLPAAWICATITLLVRATDGLDPLMTLATPYLTSLSLWPGGPWIDGVYWSLITELSFYTAVFGLLCFRALNRLPALAWVLTLVSGVFLALTVSRYSWRVPGWSLIDKASEPLMLRHGALFAVGVWMWMFSERRLRPAGVLGLGLAIAISGLEIYARGASLQAGEAHAAAGQPLVLPILIWGSLVAIMLGVTRWPARFTPGAAFVRSSFRRVGLATYPLYLVHNAVGATLVRRLVLAGTPKWAALGLAALIVVSTAFLVALALEPRLRRALRRGIEKAAALRLAPRPDSLASAP